MGMESLAGILPLHQVYSQTTPCSRADFSRHTVRACCPSLCQSQPLHTVCNMHNTMVQLMHNAGTCDHVVFLVCCITCLHCVIHSWMCTGETPFVYQSCTHQQQPRGSMEGFFKFVEGTTRQPTGPCFDVEASPVRTAWLAV